MPTKVYKDKTRCAVTEYEVRTINEDGDAEDVEHFETEIEARKAAAEIIETSAVAVAIEKHTSKRPHFLFAEPDVYKTIATFGSTLALSNGGWLDS